MVNKKITLRKGEWTKCAAIRLLTFVGGIVGSSIAAHWWANKKLREEYEKQLQEVKDFYKSKHERSFTVKDAPLNARKNPFQTKDAIPEEQVDLLKEYGSQQVTTGEARIPYPEELEKLRSQVTAAGGDIFPREEGAEIYLISREEFYDNDDLDWDDQEKTSLLYYEEDDVVADPLEDVYEDYFEQLGVDFLGFFRKYDSNEYAYVRNTKIHMDFEIELVKGAYHRTVLGFAAPEETQKQNRKFRNEDG